ncbi:UNVERIFIED_CONTAM: hypothetical protein GTU68_034351 [Idotea baltica]|nr:hypothetical protein [Idotea baltica]
MWLDTVTLESDTVTLLPLHSEHSAQLLKAAADGNLWDLWYTTVPKEDTIQQYIETAIQQAEQLPFAVMEKTSGKIIGTTRLLNADPINKRVGIGATWYSKSHQKTSVNTECKLLLLTHAFETLDCIAVEFRTHWHNHASRAAIARLGAKQDGVLRNHQRMANGSYRDTVVFSIINHEWPTVKVALESKLTQNRKS